MSSYPTTAATTKVMGRRSIAALIDVVVLGAVFTLLAAVLGTSDTDASDGSVSAELTGAPFLLWCAIAFVYYYVAEAILARTLGKALLGLRVVAVDGARAGGQAVALRTLLRVVDALPVLYLVGFVVALAGGERRQRIGDLAGKTLVVRAR